MAHGDYCYEIPERDIGPNSSSQAALQELRQMANDFNSHDLGLEVNQLRKIEDFYALTNNFNIKGVDKIHRKIKEKKYMMEDALNATDIAGPSSAQPRRNRILAIGDGSGADLDKDDKKIDKKLKDMENRILEARRSIECKQSEEWKELQKSLTNYLEVFKKSMESLDTMAKSPAESKLPKTKSFKQLIKDTEDSISQVNDGQGDAELSKTLRELKKLRKYNSLRSSSLPFIPDLPSNFEQELNDMKVMNNDVLENFGVEDDLVEVPMTEFMKHVPLEKKSKSILKKIKDGRSREKRDRSNRRHKSVSFK